MLSHRTRTKLARLIEAVGQSEFKIELAREDLAANSLFEPFTAFKRLDSIGKGFISARDLHDFLYSNASRGITLRECEDIINSYGQISRLNYSAFLDFVLPKEDRVLRSRVTLREPYDVGHKGNLPSTVEIALLVLIQREAELNNVKQRLLDDVHLCHDFTPAVAFHFLDAGNVGSIDITAISRFLRDHDVLLTEQELLSFLRRVDLDHDSLISFSEFLAFASLSTPSPSAKLHMSPARMTASYVASPLSPKQRVSDETYRSYVQTISGSPKRSQHISPQRNSLSKSYADYLASSPARRELRYETPERGRKSRMEEIARTTSRSPLRRSNFSPSKVFDEEHLIKTLKEQINIERNIEQAKSDLALRPDFNLLEAFRTFDTYESAKLSSLQFERGLNKYGVYPLANELKLFTKRLDQDQDGLISYAEFAEGLLPHDITYANLMRNRQPSYVALDLPGEIPFSLETKRQFADLLRLSLSAESACEAIRQRLSLRRDFSVYDAFKTLDRYDQGYITIDEFKRIFEDYGIFATRADVANLVERYDTDKDGRVTFSEFYSEMSPKAHRKILY